MKKLIPLLVIVSLLLTACAAQEPDGARARAEREFGAPWKRPSRR